MPSLIPSSMATVSLSSSPWPSPNPNPDYTSASDSDSTFPMHRDRGDETESLDSFSSMSLNSDEPNQNSDRIPNSSRDVSLNQSPISPTSPNSPATPPPAVLHLSFNQDHACFAVGTDRGFRIAAGPSSPQSKALIEAIASVPSDLKCFVLEIKWLAYHKVLRRVSGESKVMSLATSIASTI